MTSIPHESALNNFLSGKMDVNFSTQKPVANGK